MERLFAITVFARHASAVRDNHGSRGAVIRNHGICTSRFRGKSENQAKTTVILHGTAAFTTYRGLIEDSPEKKTMLCTILASATH